MSWDTAAPCVRVYVCAYVLCIHSRTLKDKSLFLTLLLFLTGLINIDTLFSTFLVLRSNVLTLVWIDGLVRSLRTAALVTDFNLQQLTYQGTPVRGELQMQATCALLPLQGYIRGDGRRINILFFLFWSFFFLL